MGAQADCRKLFNTANTAAQNGAAKWQMPPQGAGEKQWRKDSLEGHALALAAAKMRSWGVYVLGRQEEKESCI